MAVTKIDMMMLPRIAHALELSMASMGTVLRLVGREFVYGIRAHTPKASGKLQYLCKVIKWSSTPYMGKVSVGWLRKDFKRSKFYAPFLGEGTGIYSTKSPKPITAKRKSKVPMIRYEYKGKWVSMKSIKVSSLERCLRKGIKKVCLGQGCF